MYNLIFSNPYLIHTGSDLTKLPAAHCAAIPVVSETRNPASQVFFLQTISRPGCKCAPQHAGWLIPSKFASPQNPGLFPPIAFDRVTQFKILFLKAKRAEGTRWCFGQAVFRADSVVIKRYKCPNSNILQKGDQSFT